MTVELRRHLKDAPYYAPDTRKAAEMVTDMEFLVARYEFKKAKASVRSMMDIVAPLKTVRSKESGHAVPTLEKDGRKRARLDNTGTH